MGEVLDDFLKKNTGKIPCTMSDRISKGILGWSFRGTIVGMHGRIQEFWKNISGATSREF